MQLQCSVRIELIEQILIQLNIMTSFSRKSTNPWFVLTIGALVAFIVNGVRMSYGVFVVPLEQAFGLTRSQAILPFSC